MADSSVTNQLLETWRRQVEEATHAWARLAGQTSTAAAMPDPMAFWRPVLNQGFDTWARLFAQAPVAPDLMAQWKQFLDQWVDAWARALGQVMNTEAWAQMMGKSLDQWLVAQGPVKKVADQSLDGALQAFNLASRSQLTSVAKQIVELEERIERVEDGIQEILKLLAARGRE